MRFLSTWAGLLLLCLVSQNGAFRNILRPCYASTTIKTSLESFQIDNNIRIRSINADLRMSPDSKLESQTPTNNNNMVLTNVKRFGIASAMVSLILFGVQQYAHAGVIELIQEKVSTLAVLYYRISPF